MDVKPIVAVEGFVLFLLRTTSGEVTALVDWSLNELTVLSNCWILNSESLSLVSPTDGFTSPFSSAWVVRLALWIRKFSSSMWFCASFLRTINFTGTLCLDVDGSFVGDCWGLDEASFRFVCWDSCIVWMPGFTFKCANSGCWASTWTAFGLNCYTMLELSLNLEIENLHLPSPSPSTWLWSFCRFRIWIARYSVTSMVSLSSPYNAKSLTKTKTVISSRTAIKHKIALNAFKELPNFIESCRKHVELSWDQYWHDQSVHTFKNQYFLYFEQNPIWT